MKNFYHSCYVKCNIGKHNPGKNDICHIFTSVQICKLRYYVLIHHRKQGVIWFQLYKFSWTYGLQLQGGPAFLLYLCSRVLSALLFVLYPCLSCGDNFLFLGFLSPICVCTLFMSVSLSPACLCYLILWSYTVQVVILLLRVGVCVCSQKTVFVSHSVPRARYVSLSPSGNQGKERHSLGGFKGYFSPFQKKKN